MANGSPGHPHWWDNAIPLLIVGAGAMTQAPLEHRRYALGGAIICAIAARVALFLWRRSGIEHFTHTLKKK